MNINKTIAGLLLSYILIGATGCTDKYDGYNTNKHEATEEEMERDAYRLSASLNGMGDYVIATDANTCQFMDCLMGGSFGGYIADSNDGFNGKNYASYNPEEHWIQVAFNDIIPKIFIRHSNVKDLTEDPVAIAVSNILKVLAISRITDIYGPIPYSKIGMDGALNAPYDSQEEVYNKMFEELDIAIESLTANRRSNLSPKADNVYGGIADKWTQLGNSLKLRLAMRLVNINPTLAKEKAEAAVNHSIGIIRVNADNALKPVSVVNPYRIVMYDYNGGDSRIGADITAYMNGYKDPRRDKYFTPSTFDPPVENGYYGLRSGIQIPGGDVARSYSNMNVATKDPLLWMNAAEGAFLRAEGALRGWNMGGTPEDLYAEGIRLSFEQWGAAGADQYMADALSKPDVYKDPMNIFSYTGVTSNITIKWDGAADFNAKLERIVTQKWIANFPLGIEAWSEYRRTGYPKLMKIERNNSGGKVSTARMARRLPYPQNEYTENGENVKNAISQHLKGPDNMGTDVWWALKN